MELTTRWAQKTYILYKLDDKPYKQPKINWFHWGEKKNLLIGVLTPLIATMKTNVSFIFRGYDPYFDGLKPSFFMVKKPYLRIQVCPKKGIIPTFLFFSDGIGTPKNPIPF